MFDAARPARANIPNKYGSADKAPGFNTSAYQQILREEVEAWVQQAEEREFGLWDEEEDNPGPDSEDSTFLSSPLPHN